MTTGMVRLTIDLPPHTGSVRLARRFSDFACTLLGAETRSETARLLVSELVGNAVRYAANEVRVSMWSDRVVRAAGTPLEPATIERRAPKG